MYQLKGMSEYDQEIFAYENKKERMKLDLMETDKMRTEQIPKVNNEILEDMIKRKQIIPICSEEECYKVRIKINGIETWTADYNMKLLVGYDQLSHSLCVPHLRDQYIKNGLEDELAEVEANYLPSDEV